MTGDHAPVGGVGTNDMPRRRLDPGSTQRIGDDVEVVDAGVAARCHAVGRSATRTPARRTGGRELDLQAYMCSGVVADEHVAETGVVTTPARPICLR